MLFEVPGGHGGGGALLAEHGQFVLHLAADAIALGHVFGGDAHVHFLPGVVQDAQHVVDAFGIAHAGTVAGGLVEVGAPAHGFAAAANGHVAIAQGNGLRGADDGLQARAAQAIDVKGRGFDGAARINRGHAGQVGIFGIGGDDVAHNDVAHGIGGDTGAGNGGLDHGGGQLGVGHVFQAAAKGANGGAGGADDEDVADGHGFSLGVGMRPMFSPQIARGVWPRRRQRLR